LYGSACTIELAILKEEIARVRNTSISQIKELRNGKVYLCVHCQNLLKSKKNLEAELAKTVADIDTRLGAVTELNQTPARKRIKLTSEVSEEASPSTGTTQENGSSEPQSPQVIVSICNLCTI